MNSLYGPKRSTTRETSLWEILKDIPFVRKIMTSKELTLIAFFMFLFFILTAKLFWLQIVKHDEYDIQLSKLHYKESSLDPDRGNIFALDKGGHEVQLTENITLYDLALDPKDLTEFPMENVGKGLPTGPMKPRFIEIIAPIIYKHLCVINGMHEPTKDECVKNIELFAGVDLLPKKPDLFYYGEGIKSPEYDTFDFTGYNEEFNRVVDEFTESKAMELITTRLNEKIQVGEKSSNYLGYFTEKNFLEELKEANLPFITIEKENYVYVIPNAAKGNKSRAMSQLKTILKKRKIPIGDNFERLFEPQEWRYIKIISGLNPELAEEVRNLKIKHQNEKSKRDPANNRFIGIPVLYGLILEPYATRYYPYGDFMSNIIGYVDRNGVAYYGIEQYFDETLKGKKGEIKGRSSGMAGNVGTNEFEIIQPQDGSDIYLTIDLGLQREAEQLAKEQIGALRADAINIMVLDTENGEVKASVSEPSFNPNNYNDAYTKMPLGQEYAHIIDDLSYNEIPVYIFTGGTYKTATIAERQNTGLQKYLNTNIYGPQVFIDNNISTPFEPGSIFKSFTTAIGLDTDEIRLSDTYDDKGFVEVGEYTIKNASKICEGHHNFLHALVWSCNIGMVKIIQRIQKYAFYNYLNKLGFGEITEIELAGEKGGFVDKENLVATSRLLNNSFGQGLTVTQIQLAAAYAALVNGGYYIKPTIISQIINKGVESISQEISSYKEKKKIFKNSTSDTIKEGLREVLNTNNELTSANIPEVKLGAKSGTAQIAFRGKYGRGEGRTNGTFAGVISVEDPKYVVVIWIRRPRRSQWGGFTAGPIFKQIASYILAYDI